MSEEVFPDVSLDFAGELLMGGPNDPFDPFAAASTFFTGAIDEVSLYTEPLSSDDIAAIYAAKLTGKCLHVDAEAP